MLAVWFTRRSSTGSRRVTSLARQGSTCAAPATVKRTSFHELRFCQLATERLEQAFGKATKVVSVSPDTGQQGGDAPKRRR